MGCVLAVAAAGCAGSMSGAAVPVEPVTNGHPTLTTGYDVVRDGEPVAHVEVVPGDVTQDQVRFGLRVDNRSDGPLRLPADQLWVVGLGRVSARLASVDGDPTIGDLEVPAGEARTFALAFGLGSRIAPEQVQQFNLHWSIADQQQVLVQRVTGFSRVGGAPAAARPAYTASSLVPGGQLPGYSPPLTNDRDESAGGPARAGADTARMRPYSKSKGF